MQGYEVLWILNPTQLICVGVYTRILTIATWDQSFMVGLTYYGLIQSTRV